MAINPETHVSASSIMERELCEKLKVIAKEEGRTLSAQIRWICKQYVDKKEV